MDFFNVNIKYGSYAENRVLCADGNCETLSDEDVLLARTAFCHALSPIANQTELTEICKIEEPLASDSLWRAAESFKHKAGIFSPESPLYVIAEIEGKISSRLIKSYGVALVAQLYSDVARFAAMRPFATGHDLVGAVFSAMKKAGIEFKTQPAGRIGAGLFFSSLSRREFDENQKEHFYIDCDISSLIVYAIGKELGWPVSLVVMPQHVVTKWDSPVEKFIADQGEFFDSLYFQNEFKMTVAEVSHQSSPESIVLNNFALELMGAREYESAEAYFIKSLEADPENISALIGACALKLQFNKLEEAREYCERAVRFYPNFEGSNFFMGFFLYKSGDLGAAEKLLRKTIENNPNNETAAELLKNIESRQVDNSNLSR